MIPKCHRLRIKEPAERGQWLARPMQLDRSTGKPVCCVVAQRRVEGRNRVGEEDEAVNKSLDVADRRLALDTFLVEIVCQAEN